MKLLQLELLKFKKHRGIKIGLILYLLLMIGGYFTFKEISKFSDNPLINLKALNEFPMIWELMAYLGNWMAFIILGFIGIQMVSIEFSNKTFRQNVISGLSRRDFWLSKIISAFTLTLGVTVFYITLTLILGFVFSEDKSDVFSGSTGMTILYFMLMTFGYIIIGMFTAFAIRRGTAAIFVYFIYGMFLENFIRWAVHAKMIPGSISMHFYPMNVLEDLTPLPYYSQMSNMSEAPVELLLSQNMALLGAVMYTTIFIAIMYRLSVKKDI